MPAISTGTGRLVTRRSPGRGARDAELCADLVLAHRRPVGEPSPCLVDVGKDAGPGEPEHALLQRVPLVRADQDGLGDPFLVIVTCSRVDDKASTNSSSRSFTVEIGRFCSVSGYARVPAVDPAQVQIICTRPSRLRPDHRQPVRVRADGDDAERVEVALGAVVVAEDVVDVADPDAGGEVRLGGALSARRPSAGRPLVGRL